MPEDGLPLGLVLGGLFFIAFYDKFLLILFEKEEFICYFSLSIFELLPTY